MTKLFHDAPTGLGRMMTGSAGKTKRADNDFYPTPANVTQAFMEAEIYAIRRIINIVWEPCAGNGAMKDVLAQYGLEVTASDVAPQRADIDQQNFLLVKSMRAPVIITNPPFALAADIIDHALTNSRTRYLALLLKASFWHAAERISLWQRYKPSIIYPLTWRPDFTGGGAPTMECAWHVWNRDSTENDCSYIPLHKPNLNSHQDTLL
jgi:hypothetical protein